MDNQNRVAIIEDHILQRNRTEELLQHKLGLDIVFSGASTQEFMLWLRDAPWNQRPQVLILDLLIERQPNVDVELVRSWVEAGLRIVVFSALASPPLVRGIVGTGVHAVVAKQDSEQDLIDAVLAVMRGEQWMSPELAQVIAGDPNRPELSIQEEQALILYASGLSMAEVAESMNVSPNTAKKYVDRVRMKYRSVGVNAKTKLDLGMIAWRDGYIDPTLR